MACAECSYHLIIHHQVERLAACESVTSVTMREICDATDKVGGQVRGLDADRIDYKVTVYRTHPSTASPVEISMAI